MKDTRLLLLYFLTACLFLHSCAKREVGYYVRLPPKPPPVISSDSVYFFGIVIDSNSTFTFGVPELSQSVIDSGGVAITFKSSLFTLDTWYPLPVYTFPDGATVRVEVITESPGQIILKDDGSTTPAMDYCFLLSFPK